mmetsp:Transcript_687/g.2062  ORF Transcript_687/g.2062 Transcript_687/m.2062 type:complete len:83 (+) Transcript_687:1620-1868(+)
MWALTLLTSSTLTPCADVAAATTAKPVREDNATPVVACFKPSFDLLCVTEPLRALALRQGTGQGAWALEEVWPQLIARATGS